MVFVVLFFTKLSLWKIVPFFQLFWSPLQLFFCSMLVALVDTSDANFLYIIVRDNNTCSVDVAIVEVVMPIL
jgi:hypothetical protein